MSTDSGEAAKSTSPTNPDPTQAVTSDFRLFKPPHVGEAGAGPRKYPRGYDECSAYLHVFPSGDLSDAFFTPTTSDLKAVQDSLAARTQALMNAPLKTQAMREAEQKARQAKYPTVRITQMLR